MIEINPQKIDYTKRISEERKSPVQNPKKLVNNLSKGQDLEFPEIKQTIKADEGVFGIFSSFLHISFDNLTELRIALYL